MLSSNHIVLALVIAIAFIDFTLAFAPISTSSKTSSSALELVPEQGRQLVAYSQAALAKKAKESASKASNLTSDRRRSETSANIGLARARNLMTRLLHISPTTHGAEGQEELIVTRERSLQDQLNSFYED
jgi:hypothetical protein